MKKAYRGVIKGNTVILREKPDIPEGTEALITIIAKKRLDEDKIVKKQLELIKKAPRVGKILYREREELYE
jgi:hypothetical protein